MKSYLDRNIEIVEMYLENEGRVTMSDIARHYKLSRERIRQILAKAGFEAFVQPETIKYPIQLDAQCQRCKKTFKWLKKTAGTIKRKYCSYQCRWEKPSEPPSEPHCYKCWSLKQLLKSGFRTKVINGDIIKIQVYICYKCVQERTQKYRKYLRWYRSQPRNKKRNSEAVKRYLKKIKALGVKRLGNHRRHTSPLWTKERKSTTKKR